MELTPTQAESAAIRLEIVAPGTLSTTLSVPAVVQAEVDAITHINVVVPGVVTAIHKHLGEEVAIGELLASIDSVDLGRAVAVFLEARAMTAAGELVLKRERELFRGRLTTAERVLDGLIKVNEEILTREQELRSQAVSTIRPLLEAEKNFKQAQLEKDRQLTDLLADRDARLLKLEVDLIERRIDEQASRNQLLALGIPREEVDRLADDSELVNGTYSIRATRPGIVTSRHITIGEYVDSATDLFQIRDLSRVWVIASVFESQLTSVFTGQEARVQFDSFPDTSFGGEITLIGYELDPDSRALGVRIELENAGIPEWQEEYPIRPGMFATVELVVERKEAEMVIPESAIVHGDGSEDSVFVRVGPNEFESRVVEVGLSTNQSVEILNGLKIGEEVAVTGVFMLKSALRQEELGEGHSH